jgi:aldehyde:ferredoxin oxidoreductase
MPKSYTGRILHFDLSTGVSREERPLESTYRAYLGGYGLGARVLYDRLKPGLDPLGPGNLLGFVSCPFNGTPAVASARWAVVGKSPLTGGWGDANCGGDIGPYLKFAGYDAVFVSGMAARPSYLLLQNGRAELRDAADLWGRNTRETEETLMDRHGPTSRAACIGPAGEMRSLMAAIITRTGSAAARSGLAAVMGSKNLKALVVAGDGKFEIHDPDGMRQLAREYLDALRANLFVAKMFFGEGRKAGTAAWTPHMIKMGSPPVKNWGGNFAADFPDISGLTAEAAIANQDHVSGCWHCALPCKGYLKEGAGEYHYSAGSRRPEYETQAAFGTMCLNNHTESIAMANEICDRYGLDTISTGSACAFAIECFQNGFLSKADTDGLELTWGNHRAIVALTGKIARREGLGGVLADGVKRAAERIGRGAEAFAIHIGGQEPGMHDPKLISATLKDMPMAARYQMDATPGRHTQGFGPSGFKGHVMNTVGFCVQAGYSGGTLDAERSRKFYAGNLALATGWDASWEELLETGDRIATLRHCFNLREGINPLFWKLPDRMLGKPPATDGPHKGVTVDAEAQVKTNLETLDWDLPTAKPSRRKLSALGLDEVAKDLWGQPS